MTRCMMIKWEIPHDGEWQVGTTLRTLREGDVVAVPAYYREPVAFDPLWMVPRRIGAYVDEDRQA